MTQSDDWDDEDDEPSWDDEPDTDDDLATVPCPHCARELPEDAPYCPSCDRFLSAEDFARGSRPRWVTATAIVCLVAAVIGLAFAL